MKWVNAKQIPVIFFIGVLMLSTACGGGISDPDIEATVEARVELAKSSLVAPTAAPLPTYTPAPVPTPQIVVKEVSVEKIVEVVVTATPVLPTPSPMPTPTPILAPPPVPVPQPGKMTVARTYTGSNECLDIYSKNAFCIELLALNVPDQTLNRVYEGLYWATWIFPVFKHELISPLGLHDYLGIGLWEQDISDIQLLAQDMCLFRFDLGVYRDQDCEQQNLDRLERLGRIATGVASSALPVHSTGFRILASKVMWEQYAEEDPETHRRDFRKILSHEYFHSYQGAHRLTAREARFGQEEEIDSPPVWFMEGTAEYAANIVAAKAGWIDWEYALLWRMKKIKQALREDPELSIRQNVTRADQRAIDPKHRHVATYEMGFWASAYAATLSNNDAVLKSLWDDFEKYGWQEAFLRNVGTSPEQFYKEFDDFLVVTLGPDCCSDEDYDKTKQELDEGLHQWLSSFSHKLDGEEEMVAELKRAVAQQVTPNGVFCALHQIDGPRSMVYRPISKENCVKP